ncbi:MAG: polysaccharide deacetylase family protein, partial [Pseudomonadota bacterium]
TVFLATDYLDTGRLPWPTRISSVLHFASVDELDPPYGLPLRTEAERIRAGQVLRQKLSCLDHGDRDHAIAEIEQMVRPDGLQTLKPLTWDQVRDMRDAGIRFGAHTRYHGWLDRVSTTDLEEELGPSKARIEAETDMVCRSLAYPNGNWNASIVAAAKTAGFSHAVTQDGGRNVSQSMDPFAVRRIEVPYNERIGTFACRVSGMAF